MKKFYVIKGTDRFHETKSALKEIRKQLNKAAGLDEDAPEFKALSDAEKTKAWIYKISKGPDHPSLA